MKLNNLNPDRITSRRRALVLPMLGLLATAASTCFAAEEHRPDWVEVTATPSTQSVAPGAEVLVDLQLSLADGSHANSNMPVDRNLIATTFFPKKNPDIDWGKIKYPKATYVIEWYSVDPLPVFENGAIIKVPVTIPETTGAGPLAVEGKLRVQICDDEQCYPPERVLVKVDLTVEP